MTKFKAQNKFKYQISKQKFCYLSLKFWIYFEFCALSFEFIDVLGNLYPGIYCRYTQYWKASFRQWNLILCLRISG